MRLIFTIVTLAIHLTAVGLSGCGEKPAAQPQQQPHPEVAEAQAHFTYKGKPIPPFFLADFFGGPDAPDIWTREVGGRISSVAVAGLFVKSDGSYADLDINDEKDDGGFISFDLPSDESLGGPGTNGYTGYRFVGTTPSGITVLEYACNTGGSGTLIGILFVYFEMQSFGVNREEKRERLIMRCLGAYGWGDRVYRDVKLDGNRLWLGPTRTGIPAYKNTMEPERTILLE